MTIYLGQPGFLQALPYMGRGLSAPLDLGVSPQRLLSGAVVADRIGTPRRTYSLDRKYLTTDELGLLEGLALGLYGAEPYALIDPWRRNLLTVNQSGAADYTGDTTGFTSLGTGTLGTGQAVRPPHGLLYVSLAAPASGAAGTSAIVAGDASSAAQVMTPGLSSPVVPLVSYTAQVWVYQGSGTAASWRASLAFYDSAGAIIGTINNGTGAVATAAWTQRVVSATAPSTAAYAIMSLTNAATLTATGTIRATDWQLEQAGAASAWVPGTGVPRVAFTSLGDSRPNLLGAFDSSITLAEVA